MGLEAGPPPHRQQNDFLPMDTEHSFALVGGTESGRKRGGRIGEVGGIARAGEVGAVDLAPQICLAPFVKSVVFCLINV